MELNKKTLDKRGGKERSFFPANTSAVRDAAEDRLKTGRKGAESVKRPQPRQYNGGAKV